MSSTRALRLFILCSPLGGLSGCGCEDNDPTPVEMCDGCGAAEYCCALSGICEDDPTPSEGCASEDVCSNAADLSCGDGFCLGLVDAEADVLDEDACEVTPAECECIELPPLEAGELGRHSEIAAAGDTAYISGYEPVFGDLVLGQWTVGDDSEAVEWSIVDLVPDAVPAAGPSGWRGGIEDAGDDVGRYSSIQVGSDGAPRISYLDTTNSTLEFALGSDDGSFSLHTIDRVDGARAGLFSSLALDSSDVPVVAYMVHGVRDADGAYWAQARVAQASTASPASTGDWSVETLDELLIPCTGLCAEEEGCLEETWQCVSDLGSCEVACGSDEICTDEVDGVADCENLAPDPGFEDLVTGVGLWITVVLDSDEEPVVAYHTRVPGAGEVHERHLSGSEWVGSVVESGDTVDVGQHLSLTIDSTDTLHAAYVEAVTDDLVYAQFTTEAGVLARETIDDGVRDLGDTRSVGADSAIAVASDGQLRVVYQDQTFSDLLLATRTGDDQWSVTALADGERAYGFYNDFAQAGDDLLVSSFYFTASSGGLVVLVVP